MTDEADATVEKKKRFFCFLFFHVSIKCARGGREVMDFTSSTVVWVCVAHLSKRI